MKNISCLNTCFISGRPLRPDTKHYISPPVDIQVKNLVMTNFVMIKIYKK